MRLFIACDLSHRQRHEMEVLQRQLAGYLSGVRWVKPQGMHLTLFFLGEIAGDLLSSISSSIHNALHEESVFNLKLSGCGVFPDASRARVIWVGVREGEEELKRLKSKIDLNLSGLGFEPEKRRYQPHLTLGRIRYPLQRELVEHFLSEHESFQSSSSTVSELILYESRLYSHGADYHPLVTFKLKNGESGIQ